MGAFFHVIKQPGQGLDAVRAKYQRSLAAFDAKGLTLSDEIDADGSATFVFSKAKLSSENVLRLENGDFVVVTGTLIYKNRIGLHALRNLYKDFRDGSELSADLLGHYGVLLYKDRRLSVFNDHGGLYHIYRDESERILSSSYLAVVKSLKQRTLSPQELYEYVSHGGTYGGRTYIKEVHLLDNDYIHQIHPPGLDAGRILRKPPIEPLSISLSFEDQVDVVASALEDYFRVVGSLFGDQISLALSGGHDTRHLIGLLRKVGVSPELYVYGDERSGDVRIAKAIAAGERLQLHHLDKSAVPEVELDRYPKVVEQQFHQQDGLGLFGAFGNGSDSLSRNQRTASARLQINGSGGEIFRNFWKLPNRTMAISSFLRARYDWIDWSVYTEQFDKRRYFDTMKAKVQAAIGVQGDRITRPQMEAVYPRFRLRYWLGPSITASNLDTFALMPFVEAKFAILSGAIRLRDKNNSRFHAALIREADPVLAAYPSVYGFNFSGPVPFKSRCKSALVRHLPIFIRPWLWKRKAKRTVLSKPYFLTDAYLKRVVGRDSLEVSKYIHLDRLYDSDMLNRAMTAELVMCDRF